MSNIYKACTVGYIGKKAYYKFKYSYQVVELYTLSPLFDVLSLTGYDVKTRVERRAFHPRLQSVCTLIHLIKVGPAGIKVERVEIKVERAVIKVGLAVIKLGRAGIKVGTICSRYTSQEQK